jgi:type IV pilus assembly protein PilY1
MKSPTLRTLFVLASLLAASTAAAEDIDIYAGNSSGGNSNLLLVIDNSGAWNASSTTSQCPASVLHSTLENSAGGVETCGIWRAVDSIGSTSLLGKLNMALMLFSKGSVQGGTLKFPSPNPPYISLMDGSATGIPAMKTALSSLQSGNGSDSSTANGTDVGGSMQEAWAYYTGNTGISGTTYPGQPAGTCGKNFVIFIGISRVSSDPADFNANQVFSALQSAGANATQQEFIDWTLSPNNKYSKSNNYWGDEWTRFNNESHGITTYTITLEDSSNPNPDYVRFMKSMADKGGGKPFVVDINDMDAFVQALLQVFNEVQAVNSVFAAASLPISVNAQGTFANQIFMGMFRPDGGGLPRWAGNLKQYQFKLDTTDPLQRRLFMADSLGNSAVSAAGTGFFSPNAVSFWSTKDTTKLPDSIDPTGALGVNNGTAGGFFIFNPLGAPASEGFDSPDGEVVEKGGVAQQIRLENLINDYTATAGSATNPRRLYTCTTGTSSCTAGSPGSSLSGTPFTPANDGITTALLQSETAGTPITTITRDNTTARVTLTSSMSPILPNGGTVTITGSQYAKFNGEKIGGGPPTATSFTYPVTVVPPVTATGTYTATIPTTSQAITSLTRSGTTATANVPGHGYFNGQTVAISGADAGYNVGSAAITVVDGANFSYTITVSPVTPGGGGTTTVPGPPAKTSRTIDSAANFGIERTGTIGAGPSFSQNVNVRTTAIHDYVVGDLVTISGASPSDYDGTHTITGVGAACTGARNPTNRNFCFNKNTTPASPATTTGVVGTTGKTATISTLTRASTTCTGSTPSSPNATVTAVTSAAHTFAVGDVVSISGTEGPDETLYTGSKTILTVPNSTSFTYQISTSPACSDDNVASPSMQATALGVDKDILIRWVRGNDSLHDEKSPQPDGPINIRPSVHGDVLHSRPAVVDYGGTTGVVVFYGSNDGVFRAVNGKQTGNIGTVPPGGELWGFIPQEFFGDLRRMYFNSPIVQLKSTSPDILPQAPKTYFFDGPTGVLQDVDNSKVYLYLTARRGGRVIYALDVSDPADPKFMWKRTNTDSDTGFSELGQTWSQPKATLVKGYVDDDGNPKPVLIFGAGYDPAEDAEPQPAAAARTMGRGIYILDALTGQIVWRAGPNGSTDECIGNPCELAGMTYAIPSDVTLVDRNIADESGFIDRLYVPDLGGNIWRVDLEPAGGNTPDKWQVTKFAAVGGSDTTKRKIFFPPDVVTTRTFDAVLFATGDREHPTKDHVDSLKVLNRFYMLKDTKVGNDAAGWTPIVDDSTPTLFTAGTWTAASDPVPTNLFNATPILPTSASTTPTSPRTPPYDPSQPDNGFYITLKNAVATKDANTGVITYGPAIEDGEKGVNAPTTVGGSTFFGTNTPTPPDTTVCQPNLGTARGYKVDFLTGESKFVVFDSGGLPPSPVAGVVVIDGQSIPFLIGGGNPDGTNPDDTSSIGGQEPPIPITPLRSRIYWYRDLGNR